MDEQEKRFRIDD